LPMKTRGQIKGLTLVEMLVVVAIIVLLVSMVVGVAKRIDDQSKERLCRSTITLIDNALEQFRDFGYEYKDPNFAGLTFPLDCNDIFTVNDLQNTLRNALYLPSTTVTITVSARYDPIFSGSEVLYFVLSQVPDCRLTLGKIDKSLLTNIDADKSTEITIEINSAGIITTLPFTRIIDPWGTALRYNYYDKLTPSLLPDLKTKKTFPVITSAGPDGKFDTSDDVSNREQK
jgi:prepilin-type N-terminal cleavage/methylation domain-containing protein